MNNLAQIKCQALQGVGPKISQYLVKCGIHSLQDLLFHLPLRYEDRTKVTPIKEVKPGTQVLVKGVIIQATNKLSTKRQNNLYCRLQDETGSLGLRFFHLTYAQRQQFKNGTLLLCFGEVRTCSRKFFEQEIVHPDYQILASDKAFTLVPYLTAVYPSTEGLTQRTWNKLIHQVLSLLNAAPNNKNSSPPLFRDYLPPALLKFLKLPDLISALHFLHKPPANTSLDSLSAKKHRAQQRLIVEELLAHFLCVQITKKNREQEIAPSLLAKNQLTQRFLTALPFKLTAAQQRVCQIIRTDMEKPYPMQRLLQGDVGSGKTVVAAFAAMQAIENHYQTALMAPTDILSEQHYQHFYRWLTPMGCHVVCLRSKLKAKEKRKILSAIETGKAQLVIGTHALFQTHVKFKKLGLIVVDEQHRFGVQQRLALWKKGQNNRLQAHQLFMTATPIPRTLAMTSLTDLELSFLDELPPGRLPVQTLVLSAKHRTHVIARVRNNCLQKKQVYWVCPLIEESDLVHYKAAETTLTLLQSYLPDLRLALIHGRLSSKDKETIMRKFKAGNIDVLVATTVIEVGVDIGNVNLMIIENSERLGLAQLHQLRGRVGRSHQQSYCVLLYERLSAVAKKRLSIMRKTNDGFKIAQHDLELRGPGEIYGLRQTGWQPLRIADLSRDYYLLPHVQKLSDIISKKHPELVTPIIQRWTKNSSQYCSKV